MVTGVIVEYSTGAEAHSQGFAASVMHAIHTIVAELEESFAAFAARYNLAERIEWVGQHVCVNPILESYHAEPKRSSRRHASAG
jgi:hypothetical protein